MAQPTSHNSSHATTGTTAGGWSTKRIATCALFVAVALVATFIEIPIFPLAPYLKYDPSGIVFLLAGLAFGPATGSLVCILSWLPHLFMNPVGGIMSVGCGLALTIPAGLIYKHNRTTAGLIGGMVVGGILMLAAGIIGNVLLTPLYSGVTTQQVIDMIIPILIPFNLLKIVITCVLTGFLTKPMTKLVGSAE